MDEVTRRVTSIYVLALEPSGDILGARLIDALRDQASESVSFSGVGGTAMKAAGLDSLFDPSDLAILGIFEVLPKARTVLRRVRDVLADIERIHPDVLVTIDSWGFTGRVHKALAKKNSTVKRVRYVAPQVWAWRPGRAKQLSGWIDHLLTLFPFEPPLFERHGLAATWVGHPVTETVFGGSSTRFRSENSLDADAQVLTVLPGSRKSEIHTLMPVFGQAIAQLADRLPEISVAIPTVAHVEAEVRAWAETLPIAAHVVVGSDARDDAFAASSAALSASGTVTLELARAELPHAIAYKVNPFSAFVFRRLAKTRYVNLINVLMGEEVVPECLQERCTAEVLSEVVYSLMESEPQRRKQLYAFHSALAQLSPGEVAPSDGAAKIILELSKN